MTTYHLAQLNLARARYPLDDPRMAGFSNNRARINDLAVQSPGYVWQLEADEVDTIRTKESEDPLLLPNLSIWESIEALYEFSYYSVHTDFFRRRAEWFEKLDTPVLVLWWVPAGHLPTLEEAYERLAMLEKHGPTPLAFTFKQRFAIQQMLEYSRAAP